MNTNTHERRLWWRHLLSFLIAPVTMTLVIPALIAGLAGVSAPRLDSPASIALVTGGGLLVALGLGLLVWTVALFDRVGQGTLGVGDMLGEPVKLVVQGPYRHVRNPMISAVLCILLGEAAMTASGWLLLWFAIFGALQATVIRLWEEPHLQRRYGRDYVEYRRNVPGWIPRISAWP
ncbi:RemK protein [Mycobacterium kubicae]|uniref:Isoprenylcysteine carboxylmethyltransferase family protein n=1 Tax=Mycobacterium kubicae TaxID=120959 RepID=A0AAX1JDD9_9MYCO|nr:isoprenylcysteine carboxylmethyltransferase family protein [Mycobacterium kubicae]MCV7097873.1 isoprenylcysteine carboxylmethyltransferase family protein [Mycobacterium kubicae]ORW06024.1 RemK protein [Mycobacterium kubicae]QNI10263.1 isoprenylcysteine carboxylmethyltransferase family protein [Mycobacterium kubicae]QPI38471.1 isoprenylcysteine carboxylmethyltransferase family protein [Mycobacterium kubicae]GFG63728.1 RemK protein [Mycobacterium kubicae]